MWTESAGGAVVSEWSAWSSCGEDCQRQRRRECHVTPCADGVEVQTEDCQADRCLTGWAVSSQPVHLSADDQQMSVYRRRLVLSVTHTHTQTETT